MATIDIRAAYRIAELLDALARMPSTPEPIASTARERTATLTEQLPPLHHPQAWDPPGSEGAHTVTLADDDVATLRELLLLFETMPSTPEDIVEEARAHEELLEAASEGQPDGASSSSSAL